MAASERRRSLAPWLLLTLWARVAAALRLWFLRWVRRPLLRLGVGAAPRARLRMDDGDDGGDGATDAMASAPQLTSDELPLGLPNVGNTCFINAVVQCLRVTPGFVDRLVAETARVQAAALNGDDEARAKQWHIADALCDLLDGVSPTLQPSSREGGEGEMEVLVGHSIVKERDPEARSDQNMALLRRFRQEASKCSYLIEELAGQQEQQDAEEFLSFVLELLHELFRDRDVERNLEEDAEAERLVEQFTSNLRNYDPSDPASYSTAVSNLGTLRWRKYLQQNASVITDLFCAQTVRGSQCCSCASLTCLHEEQRLLSLAIDPDQPQQTLAEALKRYGHSEQLTDDNRVFCDGYCQMKTSRLTQILIQRTPETLVLRLQRFRQSRSGLRLEKLDVDVSFPHGSDELLDITENAFVRVEGKRVLYRLVAVCAHIGNSIDAGHYVSYVRSPKNTVEVQQWIRIDDDFVSVIDEAIFQRETLSTAYLLFFARHHDNDQGSSSSTATE